MFKISEHEYTTYTKGIKDVQKEFQELDKNDERARGIVLMTTLIRYDNTTVF